MNWRDSPGSHRHPHLWSRLLDWAVGGALLIVVGLLLWAAWP
jgi:hypothetical protein